MIEHHDVPHDRYVPAKHWTEALLQLIGRSKPRFRAGARPGVASGTMVLEAMRRGLLLLLGVLVLLSCTGRYRASQTVSDIQKADDHASEATTSQFDPMQTRCDI